MVEGRAGTELATPRRRGMEHIAGGFARAGKFSSSNTRFVFLLALAVYYVFGHCLGQVSGLYDMSLHERLWVQASELIDAERWEEAEKAAAALHKHLGRADMELEAKLRFGIALDGVGAMGHQRGINEGIRDKTKFELARKALRFVIEDDGGMDVEMLINRLFKLVKARVRGLIPLKEDGGTWRLDYEAASVENLIDAAGVWLEIPKALSSAWIEPTTYSDTPHDETHMILEALGTKGQFEDIRIIAKEIIKVDPDMRKFLGPGIFHAAIAECSEALGDIGEAHRHYLKLHECEKKIQMKFKDDRPFYDDDGKGIICSETAPPGSVEERLLRTVDKEEL